MDEWCFPKTCASILYTYIRELPTPYPQKEGKNVNKKGMRETEMRQQRRAAKRLVESGRNLELGTSN
jgi:hypothetical protein